MAERNQNDELLDAQLLQALLVLSFSERLGRSIIETLNETEPKIAALIRDAKTGLASPADFRRLNDLLSKIRKVRSRAWRSIESEVLRELKTLAGQQPKKYRDIVKRIAGAVGLALPTVAALDRVVEKGEVEGRTIPEWLTKQREDDDARISNQIRFGMMSLETPDKIIRRVFGTADVLGANGATEEARRRAFEITVMAGLYVGNESKRIFTVLNPDVFDRELYLAILDDRTTDICRSLNRKVFLVGEGPYPPIHFWCRSIRVFLLAGAAPADIVSLREWVNAQPDSVQQAVSAARAQRFKRPKQ